VAVVVVVGEAGIVVVGLVFGAGVFVAAGWLRRSRFLDTDWDGFAKRVVGRYRPLVRVGRNNSRIVSYENRPIGVVIRTC